MTAQGSGALVNVSSLLGVVAPPLAGPYAMSKFALRALGATLRAELRGSGAGGVHVSTVLPAAVDTLIYAAAYNRTGRRLRPPPPVYSVDRVAGVVVGALRCPRAEVIAGGVLGWMFAVSLRRRPAGRRVGDGPWTPGWRCATAARSRTPTARCTARRLGPGTAEGAWDGPVGSGGAAAPRSPRSPGARWSQVCGGPHERHDAGAEGAARAGSAGPAGRSWAYPLWVVGARRTCARSTTGGRRGTRLHHSVGSWPLLIEDTTSVVDVVPERRLELHARAWPTGTARILIELELHADGTLVRMHEHAERGLPASCRTHRRPRSCGRATARHWPGSRHWPATGSPDDAAATPGRGRRRRGRGRWAPRARRRGRARRCRLGRVPARGAGRGRWRGAPGGAAPRLRRRPVQRVLPARYASAGAACARVGGARAALDPCLVGPRHPPRPDVERAAVLHRTWTTPQRAWTASTPATGRPGSGSSSSGATSRSRCAPCSRRSRRSAARWSCCGGSTPRRCGWPASPCCRRPAWGRSCSAASPPLLLAGNTAHRRRAAHRAGQRCLRLAAGHAGPAPRVPCARRGRGGAGGRAGPAGPGGGRGDPHRATRRPDRRPRRPGRRRRHGGRGAHPPGAPSSPTCRRRRSTPGCCPATPPVRILDDLERFTDTPVVKIDWALRSPIPWRAEGSPGPAPCTWVRTAGPGAVERRPRHRHAPAFAVPAGGPDDHRRSCSCSPAGTESAWAYTHLLLEEVGHGASCWKSSSTGVSNCPYRNHKKTELTTPYHLPATLGTACSMGFQYVGLAKTSPRYSGS